MEKTCIRFGRKIEYRYIFFPTTQFEENESKNSIKVVPGHDRYRRENVNVLVDFIRRIKTEQLNVTQKKVDSSCLC